MENIKEYILSNLKLYSDAEFNTYKKYMKDFKE